MPLFSGKISPMIIAFPHNQIQILDYNRVLKSKLSIEKIFNIISKNFIIKKIRNNSKSLKKGDMEMYVNHQWYSLKQINNNNKLDVTTLHENIISKIKINKNSKNLKKGNMEMYINYQWYSLKQIKNNNKLDVTTLHENIISKIKANKIEFISGINGPIILKKLVNSKKFNIAFKLCPTNISSVMRIADKKKIMPPKSTWFHPKPLDGLICSEL